MINDLAELYESRNAPPITSHFGNRYLTLRKPLRQSVETGRSIDVSQIVLFICSCCDVIALRIFLVLHNFLKKLYCYLKFWSFFIVLVFCLHSFLNETFVEQLQRHTILHFYDLRNSNLLSSRRFY